MRFTLENELQPPLNDVIVGNVYNVRGGSGAKNGYMMVIVSIINSNCVVLTVDKSGNIVGGSSFGKHYFEDKCPIAFCKALETLSFEIARL